MQLFFGGSNKACARAHRAAPGGARRGPVPHSPASAVSGLPRAYPAAGAASCSRARRENHRPKNVMNAALRALAKISLPKILRHALAAAGGWLAAKGFEGDVYNLASIVTGALCVGGSALASAWLKLDLEDEGASAWKKIAEALTQQIMAAISGWLLAAGYEGSPADTEAVALFLANLGLSHMSRPDPALDTPRRNPLNR